MERNPYAINVMRNLLNANFNYIPDTLFLGNGLINNNFAPIITLGPIQAGSIIISGGATLASAILTGNIPSTSTTTGTLIINATGGAGIGGNINAGGYINTNTNYQIGNKIAFAETPAPISSLSIGFNAGDPTIPTQNRCVYLGEGAGKVNNATTDTIFIGYQSGLAVTSGTNSVIIGSTAFNITNNISNAVVIGAQAGQSSIPTDSVLVGFQAGKGSSGIQSVVIGSKAGFVGPLGTNCVIIGYNTGTNAGTGGITNGLTIIGANSAPNAWGSGIIMGNQCAAGITNIGASILLGTGTAAAGNIIDQCIFIGDNAGGAAGTSVSNIFIGYGCVAINAPGFFNTAVGTGITILSGIIQSCAMGYQAIVFSSQTVCLGALSNAKGDGGVAIGYQSNVSPGSTNSVAIGNFATTLAVNAISIGAAAGAAGSSTGSVLVGQNASATGTQGIAIGQSASCAGNNSVVLGNNVTTAVNNTVEVGNRSIHYNSTSLQAMYTLGSPNYNNLRILAGSVLGVTGNPTFLTSGYTSTRLAMGQYQVNFTNPFLTTTYVISFGIFDFPPATHSTIVFIQNKFFNYVQFGVYRDGNFFDIYTTDFIIFGYGN